MNIETMTDGDLAALDARIKVEQNKRYQAAEAQREADRLAEQTARWEAAKLSLARLEAAATAGFDLRKEIRDKRNEVARLEPWNSNWD